jgi:hypothetical protein
MPLLSEEMVIEGISPVYLTRDKPPARLQVLLDSSRLWQERAYSRFTIRRWLLDQGVVVVAEEEQQTLWKGLVRTTYGKEEGKDEHGKAAGT